MGNARFNSARERGDESEVGRRQIRTQGNEGQPTVAAVGKAVVMQAPESGRCSTTHPHTNGIKMPCFHWLVP